MTPFRAILLGCLLIAGEVRADDLQAEAWQLLESDRSKVTDAHVKAICHDLSLTSLDLSRCHRITEACLDDVARLRDLTTLDLNDNRGNLGAVSTFEKLKLLPKLTTLYLRNLRAFNGKGPELLPALRHLDVSREIGGFGDAGFSNLQGLAKLTRFNANHSRNWHANKGISYEGVQSIEHMQNLEFLGLYGIFSLKQEEYNQLFAKLPELTELELGFNWQLKGDNLNFPDGLTSLDMRESWALLDDSIVRMDKSQLLHLNLYDCHAITDKTLLAMSNARQLQTFILTGAAAVTDEGVRALRGNTSLNSLSISDNERVSDEGLRSLSTLPQLKTLNLWHLDNVNGSGLSCLREMTNLESLTLSACFNLEDDGLRYLVGKKQLKFLYLDACAKITDDGLRNLSTLTELRELTLTDCPRLTRNGIEQLSGLQQLTYLDLTGCTSLTLADVAAIRRLFPNCDVVY